MTFDGSAFAVGYVTLTVPPATPSAAADAYGCPFNASCSVNASVGVLSNDASANLNAVLSANLSAAPSSGSVALAADGSFVYTPAA
jgi:hypothetical protein